MNEAKIETTAPERDVPETSTDSVADAFVEFDMDDVAGDLYACLQSPECTDQGNW